MMTLWMILSGHGLMAISASVSGMSTCLMVHAQITLKGGTAGKAHLNIFELFKTEQSHMEASILQLAAGGTVRSKGPSRNRKEETIKKIEDKFDAGDYFFGHTA